MRFGVASAALVGAADAQDACTIAALAAFDPCCPGGGGGYTACIFTSTTYTEMCQIAECTAALNHADAVCADVVENNPVAQAYGALRLAVSCAGLDDPCIESVRDTMDVCQLSATLNGDPNAIVNAAQVSCTEPECVGMMQEQVQTCSGARDFNTALNVQMFVTTLVTCEQINGAVDAVTSAQCSAAQMEGLMSTCYFDAAHTQPNCAACLPMLSTMMGTCPGSFLGGPASDLNAMCATSIATQCPDLATGVTSTCCADPTVDCASGMPTSCNSGCARVFVPFMNECAAILGPQAAMLAGFMDQCQAALSGAGGHTGGGH